jgi:hypothetical protein
VRDGIKGFLDDSLRFLKGRIAPPTKYLQRPFLPAWRAAVGQPLLYIHAPPPHQPAQPDGRRDATGVHQAVDRPRRAAKERRDVADVQQRWMLVKGARRRSLLIHNF